MRAEEAIADGMLSVEEAFTFLSISRSHLYELMDSGEIPYAKVGRCRRIPKKLLIAYIAANLKGIDRLAIMTLG